MMKRLLAATALMTCVGGVANAGGFGGEMSPIGELPHAEAGQCFARIVTPAVYEQVPETVVVQQAYMETHVAEPEFAPSSTEVMVREAGVKYIVRQPTYETRQEQVMVKPGYERLKIEPPRFEYVTETITIGEPRKMWKPGANLSGTSRVDARTGQVYCLVEVPPKTTTVTKRVMVEAEKVARVAVEPQYISVSKQVLVDRGGVEEVPVPPEFRSIPTQELLKPAYASKEQVAPKTATVERTVLRAPEKFEWVQVLCDTNATASSITDLQMALRDRGYYKGPIDGIVGPQTQAAVKAFQQANNLPHQGYVSIDTLRALGLAGYAPASVAPTMSAPAHDYYQPAAPQMKRLEPAAPAPQTPVDEEYYEYGAPAVGAAPTMDGAAYIDPIEAMAQNAANSEAGVEGGQLGYVPESTDPTPYEKPREYSVRRRLNWDGK